MEIFLTDSDRLHWHRRKLGLSQARLAQLVKVAPSMICMIESGKEKPTPLLASRIAAALNQKPSAIFKSIFDPREFDPMFGTEKPRTTTFVEKIPTPLEEAMRIFRENEVLLTDEQARMIADSMGLSPFRLFPTRFNALGNPINQPTEAFK